MSIMALWNFDLHPEIPPKRQYAENAAPKLLYTKQMIQSLTAAQFMM